MVGKTKEFLPLIGALALVFLFFLPSIHYDFLSWDDLRFVKDNEHLSLTFENIRFYFTTCFCELYTPLTFISYMFDMKNPLICHLHNLLLYLGSLCLLGLIFRKLKIGIWISAAAVLLFGLSAQRVESVVWIAERKDMLCLFFSLLSFYIFMIDYAKNRLSYGMALFFLLAMLGKPAGSGLIAAYLFYACYQSENFRKIRWRVFIPFAVIFVLYSALFYYVSTGPYGMPKPVAQSLPRTIEIVFFNFLFYTGTALVCFDTNPVYPLVGCGQVWPWRLFLFTGLILSTCLWFARSSIRKMILTFIGFLAVWAGFFVTASGIYMFNPVDYADRYNLLPGLTFVTMLAFLLSRIQMKYGLPEKRFVIILLCCAVANAFFLYSYMPVWKSTRSLFEYVCKTAPGKNYVADRVYTLLFTHVALPEHDIPLCYEIANSVLQKSVTPRILPRDTPEIRQFRLIMGTIFMITTLMQEGKSAQAMQFYRYLRSRPNFDWGKAYETLSFERYALNLYLLLERNASPAEMLDFIEWQARKSKELKCKEEPFLHGMRLLIHGKKKAALQIWEQVQNEYPAEFMLKKRIRLLKEKIAAKP